MFKQYHHMEKSVKAFALLMGALYGFVLLHNLIPHCHGQDHCHELHSNGHAAGHVAGHTHSHSHHSHAGSDCHSHSHAASGSQSGEHSGTDMLTGLSESSIGVYSFLSRALSDIHHHAAACSSDYVHLRNDKLRAGAPLIIPACYAGEAIADLTIHAAPDLTRRLYRFPDYAQVIVFDNAPLRAPPILS